MRSVPLITEQSPLLLLELLFKLRVRDIMTRELITCVRSDTMRHVQRLMKENSITGVPVAEDDRLLGIVSIDDIIKALEAGSMEDPVEAHMTANVVVLDEEMPLSIAVSYFGKYPYGRFPVLDKDRRLVGIITSRNVNASLLLELFKEVDRIESRALDVRAADSSRSVKVFHVRKYDFERAGQAANEIKTDLERCALDARLIRRVAVAAYELEMNQVVHSDGGTLTCHRTPERVEIIAHDWGPGIADIALALQEGYSTANEWIRSLGFGAGMGLPNAKRVADEFHIHSHAGSGTTVKAVIRVAPEAEHAGG